MSEDFDTEGQCSPDILAKNLVFSQKNNIVVSSQIRLLCIPNAWITTHEKCEDMFFVIFFYIGYHRCPDQLWG